jgi:hypothetical protein
MNTRYSGAYPLALALCGLAAGCGPDWSAVAACLPAGVTLTTEFCPDRAGCSPEERTTVKRKLAELGARARGGKLYDSAGQEIVFHQVPSRGAPPPRELEEQERRQLEELRRKHTVVMMYPLEQVP